MALDKFKISDEDLNTVTGGHDLVGSGCPYFMQSRGNNYENKCPNCFFYHKDEVTKEESCSYIDTK